jgi:paraquat-inducible protein B
MNPKNSHFKIGVFAIVAVALLLAGLMTLGARDRFKPRVRFETAFTGDVSGLSVGSPVMFRGVTVGRVTDIRLAWNKYPQTKYDYVLVEFEIDSSYLSSRQRNDPRGAFPDQVAEGLRMQLEGQGITGISILKMDMLPVDRHPAPEIDWKPDRIYIPSASSFFRTMLDSISESLDKIRHIDFEGLVKDIRELLVSLDSVADKLSRVDIERIGAEAHDRILELKTTNERIRLLADEARSTIHNMQLPAVASGVDRTIKDLRVVIERLDKTLATVGEKVGQIEVQPLNDSLINARRATRELEETLRTIRSYPSGALFGEPPAPARSVNPPKP